MPIPKPRGDESESEFLSRCMSDLNTEYPDNSQRAAICYNSYREHKNKPVKLEFFKGLIEWIKEELKKV